MARRPRNSGGSSSAGAAKARAYTSPTLVLLAMDWPDGAKFDDFLGFAILRVAGLPSGREGRIPVQQDLVHAADENAQPLPSNLAPFQKFLWWDAGINDADRGKTFKYTITPGARHRRRTISRCSMRRRRRITVPLPKVEEDGISTWFNRAVVSSQAFTRQFPDPTKKKIDEVMKWLANGLQDAFPKILPAPTTIAARSITSPTTNG